jgi:hypothetical protein
MSKTRTLYYHYSPGTGLLVVVTKVRGTGVLRSYGYHNQTHLDNLLGDADFDAVHCDGYLEIRKSFLTNDRPLTKDEETTAIGLINTFYNCSERVNLSREEFFNLLK